MRNVQIVLDTTRLDLLTGALETRAMAVLDKIAFDVLRTAQPLTAIDTGAMRSSGYVSGASGGGASYSAGASEAQGRRPGVVILDEIEPRNKFERIVGFSVEYSYLQEMVKPYLTPAIEARRGEAETAWRALFA